MLWWGHSFHTSYIFTLFSLEASWKTWNVCNVHLSKMSPFCSLAQVRMINWSNQEGFSLVFFTHLSDAMSGSKLPLTAEKVKVAEALLRGEKYDPVGLAKRCFGTNTSLCMLALTFGLSPEAPVPNPKSPSPKPKAPENPKRCYEWFKCHDCMCMQVTYFVCKWHSASDVIFVCVCKWCACPTGTRLQAVSKQINHFLFWILW